MKTKTCLRSFLLLTFLLLFFQKPIQAQNSTIESPEVFFGFKPGADRRMFTYEKLIEYLHKLDAASTKLKMLKIGESPLGKPIYIAFISAEKNIRNLAELKEINKRLALDFNLGLKEKESLVEKGKVFVLATLSMHSNEVGPSQAAPLIAYDMLTTSDTDMLSWMDETVFMMVPCHNPDGMDMVVNNYKKYKGTKYEGSSMPGVYHKYVGHDNNRDFVTLSQSDTKAIAAIYNKDWFPQVMVEKHQMGSTGPRYFVPPMHDPIAENIDASVWNWTWVFGSNMVKDMTEKGLSGISQHYLFDDYWPGSTETCLWKNVIAMLTEAAGARYAKPIFIEPNELRVYGKGLSEYKKSINMPDPWPGGWWRLSDIVDYEIESTYSILKTSFLHKEEILNFRNDLCKKEVLKGKNQPPYYYILPKKQHDASEFARLINLLREHGVDVYELQKAVVLQHQNFSAGDMVVPLAQPFRPFIKEVMEKQKFPVRHYTPGGKIIKPYDITSWSLPAHRGVTAVEINAAPKEKLKLKLLKEDYSLLTEIPNDYWAAVYNVNNNESFLAAFYMLKKGIKVSRLQEAIDHEGQTIPKGSFVIYHSAKANSFLHELKNNTTISPVFIAIKIDIKTSPVKMPRIALVETYFHDMDAGWTRFVFDSYHIPFKVVRPGGFEKMDFSKKFDMVIFPDANTSVLMEGKWKSKDDYHVSSYPPEFTKGVGKKGMEKLMTFLDKGGKIISWGRSGRLFTKKLSIKHSKEKIEEFNLPIRDISKQISEAKVFCPGSLLKIKLTKDHPLTLGLPAEIGVFFRGRPVFSTSIPNFDMDRRVIGKFPEEQILQSGYCENVEKLADKSVLVWLKKGRGQLVLFGFNPQFRASTQGNYKLLFNSILLPEIN